MQVLPRQSSQRRWFLFKSLRPSRRFQSRWKVWQAWLQRARQGYCSRLCTSTHSFRKTRKARSSSPDDNELFCSEGNQVFQPSLESDGWIVGRLHIPALVENRRQSVVCVFPLCQSSRSAIWSHLARQLCPPRVPWSARDRYI